MLNKNEGTIYDHMSEFQNGGRKGRSTIDNIITVNAIIEKRRKLGKKTYIFFADAVKCFDKLWLKDCLLEMYKAGVPCTEVKTLFDMNKRVNIRIKTPTGIVDPFEAMEIVKQGTVTGPILCCIVTDKVNDIGEPVIVNYAYNINTKMMIFVDDVNAAGGADDIRKGIRNCNQMEKKKKVTYGLKKSKYMVINTGRDKEEIISEEVKEGKIEKIDEYKHLGLWINEKGNMLLTIQKNTEKLAGKISQIKNIASRYNTGKEFIRVRMKMYEACVVPSLLYNLEGWSKMSKEEILKLEQQQAYSLTKLLELPRTTPYWGMLSELGIWSMEKRVEYRKLMLFQNIMKSDEKRISRKIIIAQKNEGMENSFYGDIKDLCQSYEINIERITQMLKSELKSTIKKKINESMVTVLQGKKNSMRKLRFLDMNNFKCKEYIKEEDGSIIKTIMEIRLNMVMTYDNYKNNKEIKSKMCPHCNKENDSTEHMFKCTIFGVNYEMDEIGEDNSEQLKTLATIAKTNMNLRK